jgi:hypothetical protein
VIEVAVRARAVVSKVLRNTDVGAANMIYRETNGGGWAELRQVI